MALLVAPAAPGIYTIENVNMKRQYVGRSVNVRRRLYNHQLLLDRRRHPCLPLQHDWTKYAGWVWTISCELYEAGTLAEQEEWIIEKRLKHFGLYNAAHCNFWPDIADAL